MHYLSRMCNFKLHLGGENSVSLLGFTDSDWPNCLDTRQIVGGCAYMLGSSIISWQAWKQKPLVASSCKAEYVAAFEASKEAMWLHTPLNTIGYKPDKPIMIPCNNNTINLSENPRLHDQVKHIDIKHHFLQECIQSQDIVLSYIHTHNSIADIFMKALNTKEFTHFKIS